MPIIYPDLRLDYKVATHPYFCSVANNVGDSVALNLAFNTSPVEAGVRRKRVTIAAIANEPLVRLIVMERSINLFIRRAMGEFVE
jgi:hypothetical protein